MSLKNTVDDVQCYVGNVSELLEELEGTVFEDTGEVIKFDIQKGGLLAQLIWDQLRETILECEGKQVVVKYPGGFLGQAIKTVLLLAQFNLEAPVAIDSPDLVPDHIKQQIIDEANNA